MNNSIGGEITPDPPPHVHAIIRSWDSRLQNSCLTIRQLIFSTAAATPQVGPIDETLKWNQPAYLTRQSGAGTTIRIGTVKGALQLGLYVHCQTTLVDTFKQHYQGQLMFEKNRAILIDPLVELPRSALKHCISLALTYHLHK